MAKIKNKKRLQRCFKAFERGISQKYLSKQLGITPKRFRQIYRIYKATGEVPVIGQNVGRPIKIINPEHKA